MALLQDYWTYVKAPYNLVQLVVCPYRVSDLIVMFRLIRETIISLSRQLSSFAVNADEVAEMFFIPINEPACHTSAGDLVS